MIDSREQLPLDLSPMKSVTKKLDCADYSVLSLEHKIAIERKSLNDLVGCVGRERVRFETMLQALVHYEHRAVIIAADWAHIDLKFYRGVLHPSQIYGTLLGWAMGFNVSLLFAGDEARAGRLAAKCLWVSANREYRKGCYQIPLDS